MLRRGSDPVLLLKELRELGDCRITANTAAIPGLGALDAGRCYLTWEIVLSTAASREEICDVFIFVEGCCELVVEPAPSVAEAVAGERGAGCRGTAD